jgi:hypothetical protein
MPHSIGRLSASASSHPGLSLAAFITNIAESDFRYTQRGKYRFPIAYPTADFCDFRPKNQHFHAISSSVPPGPGGLSPYISMSWM